MYRKLIKFGQSTHVVSVPPKWLKQHKLQKGDNVHISHENDSLIVNATKKATKEEKKQITIAYTTVEEFRHQLIAAYINNYKIINVIGYNPKKDIAIIREHVNRFLALEIIQQSAKKIVIQDFCNIKETEPIDLIRRIDIVIRAMFEDAIQCLQGEDCIEQIKQKEMDINRLSFLGLKVLNKSFSAQARRELNLTIPQTFYLWELFNHLEKTADQIKRMIRYKDPIPQSKNFTEHIQKTKQLYEQAITSHYKSDLKAALKVRVNRTNMYRQADKIFKETGEKNQVIFEKIKNLNTQIAGIASNTVRLHPKASF